MDTNKLLTRSYKLNIQDVDTFDIESGKKNNRKRFRFSCHGDIITEWNLLIPFVKGYKPFKFKNFKLYINDNLLNNIKGIEFSTKDKNSICKINLQQLRNELRNIEMPDTPRNNRLINIENQFMNQSLECLRVPLQQNINVEPLSKEIMMNGLFMGGICVELELSDYPLKEIMVLERYYDYISSKLKDKENERKKKMEEVPKDPVKELFKVISNKDP